MQDPIYLTVSHVAKRLGMSEANVRRLDAQLAPQRASTGVRLYSVAVIDAFAAQRAARAQTK